MEIKALFSSGLTPSQAYKEFLRNVQSNSEDELNFHFKKAEWSKCPRRRDFNLLYIKYCCQKFGGRNGAEMFGKLEERINEFTESNEVAKISYQLYNKDENLALILAIVTPLMQRVHSKVIGKLIFPKKLNKIQSSKYLSKCVETQKNSHQEIHFCRGSLSQNSRSKNIVNLGQHFCIPIKKVVCIY